jgi:hypothetical protein
MPQVEGLWDMVAKLFTAHCKRKICGVRRGPMNIAHMHSPIFKDHYPPKYTLELNQPELSKYLRTTELPTMPTLPSPPLRRMPQDTTTNNGTAVSAGCSHSVDDVARLLSADRTKGAVDSGVGDESMSVGTKRLRIAPPP